MFQQFTVKSDPKTGPVRLAAIRAWMSSADVDCLIVPHSDEYQNEYLPACAERLAWLTGFTGSAGAAIVTTREAYLFVDGRYTLQAGKQVDTTHFTLRDLVEEGITGWLDANLKDGMAVAIDPWVHTMAECERLERTCAAKNAHLKRLSSNPVDAAWLDRPTEPSGQVTIQKKEHAGRLAGRKISDIAAAIRKAGADAHVVTDATSLSWLFNIRGADVAHTPLVLARAIIPAKGRATLFIAKDKLDTELRAYLTQICDLAQPSDLHDALDLLSRRQSRVLLDPARAPDAVANRLKEAGATIIKTTDPVLLPRACKNTAELRGARAAHLRDGVAMVHFLAWLDANAATPGLTEIDVARELEEARRATGERLGEPLRDISFDTISGSGPNGAIVHYRVDESSNRTVEPDDLFLLDSGGQYVDGTTDITRVITLGTPTQEQKRHFTLVLKGMIAVSVARFPEGTRGMDLDVLARNALWQAGLDYAHGTGHGVGSYLGVHEGPQNISRRGTHPLLTGMIVSNEPGYYKVGSHGIRIENLVVVTAPKTPAGGDKPMHGFETLTLCPIDRRLVDRKLMTPDERRWLNRYHATVRRKLSPLIEDKHVLAWLEQATARI